MLKDYLIDQLRSQFGHRTSFAREELFGFFRHYAPDLPETTFRWRLHDLKKQGVVHAVSRSELSLSHKPAFTPGIDSRLKSVFNKLQLEFPYLKKAIWSTHWLTEFMHHIPIQHWTVVEVEKESTESVFFFLKDKYKNVFLEPEEKQIDWYISASSQAVIVKSLVTLAPLRKLGKIQIPALEKILVDIFIERILYRTFQGSELAVIFMNAYNNYPINLSTLRAYARRRGKESELIDFLETKTGIPKDRL